MALDEIKPFWAEWGTIHGTYWIAHKVNGDYIYKATNNYIDFIQPKPTTLPPEDCTWVKSYRVVEAINLRGNGSRLGRIGQYLWEATKVPPVFMDGF